MWILYICIAIVLWSLVNISDSYLVEKNKHLGHPIGSLVIFSSLFAIVAAAVFYSFAPIDLALSSKDVLILITAGFCNLFWIIFYFYALKDTRVSSVIPWFLLVPFFAYVLGYLFLGETLRVNQIAGGLIIMTGGLILSIGKSDMGEEKKYKVHWRPIVLMSTASLLVALWGVLFKFVSREVGFWTGSFWEHIGLVIAGMFTLAFVPKYRKGFIVMLRTGGRGIFLINIFSESATIIGNLLSNYALLLVPISLVYVAGVFQPAVVFILGILCTIFFPHILQEDISKRNILHKVASIGIMAIGSITLILS